ncbi:36938_t:CDS:2, partial [Gigaspora margarita]
SHWLYEEYQDKDLGTQPLVNLPTVFLPEPSEEPSIPTTILWTNNFTNLFIALQSITAYSSSHTAKKVIEKKIYTETIRIACKAINIAIEINDQNIFRFLKEYITEKRHLLVENAISASHSGQETNVLKEYSKSNIIETSPTGVSNPIKKEQPPRNKGKQPKLTCGPRTNSCGKCELHNHDFIEVNGKNKWVESSDLESDNEIDLE